MPLYKSPIKPYDPVIPQEGTRNFLYLRDSFYGEGQDSYSTPFSQNQEMFSKLTNIMPISSGVCQLRYGYALFNNPSIGPVQRIYSYQNILSNTRKLIYISGNTVDVSEEDGTSLSSILTSIASNPRSVSARDYILFPQVIAPFTWPSGQQSDGKKWHSINGLSDWGLAQPASTINVTNVTATGNITLVSVIGRVYAGAFLNSTTGHYSNVNVGLGSFTSGTPGPFFPTTVTQTSSGLTPWVNPTSIEVNDGVVATATFAPGPAASGESLLASGFGFTIPSNATIYGISATISKRQSGLSFITDNVVELLKAGIGVGTSEAQPTILWPTTLTPVNYGGSTDLWGTTWTPADINNANFGIAIGAKVIGIKGASAEIDYVTLSVTYATGTGANTGTISSRSVSITLPTSNPPAGADKFVIGATLDGGDTTTIYVLDTVPIATTTYLDNTPDNVLVTNNIGNEIDDFGTNHGLFDNDFPPLGLQFPLKYRGRVYGAIQETLYFSKNLDEVLTSTGLVLGRYEEAWPATNTLDISTQKESIRGLLTDGDVLYIGTERHMWRLSGDSPSNFSKPEIVFNEVGILNQDVWQIVFAEGRPLGMMWMTPDRRVIMSNFGNYQDAGTPIQDVLNTLNPSASTAAWGGFFSEGAYDVYILAIPTGSNTTPDTFCVYDLRSQRWLIWIPADTFSSALYNINSNGAPQWLMAASTGKVYQFTSASTADRVGDTPIPILPTIQTPWMHLGEPTKIKTLNEIEVVTGDSSMTLTIDGASTFPQTLSPNNVVTSSPLVNSGNRGFKKVYLASSISRDRFYRFTFNGTGSSNNVLDGFTIEAVPIFH